MPDTRFAQKLLALFTSPECAEAIAGDFMEARGNHGQVWVWRQILTTTAALCGNALITAPLRSARVLVAGCVLFGALAFSGFAPVAMIPQLLGSPTSWMWLAFSWWSAAFFTGFMLVRLSPARGMAASVALALMGELFLAVLRLTILQGDILAGPGVFFHSIAALAAVPLVLGSATARRRILGAAGAAPIAR